KQHILEYALDRAEHIVESARQRPAQRRISCGRKSLYQKLYELFMEVMSLKNLRRNVNLLEKLVSQESVSCLVVNLYPNEGYSLMLRGKNGSDSETIRLPYEEGELLEYLDAEELPPILVDLLEKSQVNIFHCGCVVVEVRDYRQSSNTKMPTYQSRHVLLRPTMQTLICDVHAMTSDHHKWTQDDKLQLESQLILATAEPLCLDPSISVTCTANRLLYNKQKMNTHSMKRCFKRHSRAALNRQQELSHLPMPPQLRLYDYLQRRKERKPPVVDLKISKIGNCVDTWKQNNCQLTVPKEIDVEKYAVVEKSLQLEDSQPTTVIWPAEEIVDDYTFECEVGGQAQKTKVSIFQSMGDPLVYGKIYCAKEQKAEEENTDLKLIHPPFLIGSKIDADRFLTQYKGVYERDVKCQVKMSRISGSVGQGPPSPTKDEGDGISSLVQTSVLGKGVKHRPPPIKMPSGSGSSSSGNLYSSQTTSGLLKCPTPPPAKSQALNRKHSMELGQVGLLSPASLSPMGSTQRTTSSQVMANPTGLNFINVVSSVCSPQTLMSGSNPMLGPGLNLSGILPPGSLMPTIQSAAQTGNHFGLNSSAGLGPLNLLQIPTRPVFFNPLQQPQLSQFSPQQSQSATSSPQQQGETSDQGSDQSLGNQQTAVINLGVGSFMSPQAAAPNAAAANGYGNSSSSGGSSAAAYRQPRRLSLNKRN
uniref:SPT20 homolog, SAGA complex component n=1 Tax=Tetraodon nigroviridis TaxID=99883 RepID=H3CX35_TETNG